MKRILFGLLALAVSGCQCGPGIACNDKTPCPEWGTCSPSGFCVAIDAGGEELPMGTPHLVITADDVDLGLVGCGTDSSTSLELGNDGTAPLHVTARSNESTFTVPAEITIPPMTTVPLSVLGRVPQISAAGVRTIGILTLTTDDPVQPRLTLTMRVTSRGVTLTAAPPVASFGVVPNDFDAPEIDVRILNSGNQAANVTLSNSDDPQFSFSAQTAQIDGGADAVLQARFHPTMLSPSRATVTVSVTEPVCGAPLEPIELRGQGTTGLVGLSTTDLFFGDNGRVSCGTIATAKTFTLTNAGGVAFAWTAALALGTNSPFTVNPASGTVPAMNSVMVTITPNAIPATASTVEGGFSDVLVLSTDAANDQPHQINLHQSAHGAVLRLTPNVVQFGGVPVQSSATASFESGERRHGLGERDVVGVSSAFTLEQGAPTSAIPGSQAATVRFSPGSNTSEQNGMLSLNVVQGSGVMCDAVPGAVVLQGSGTSGSVSYSPIALNFGLTSCGATANPQNITFTNVGNQPYRVTPSLSGSSSPYTVSMVPTDGLVASDGGTLQLRVTPSAIPATSAVSTNLYGATLTVTTDIPGDTPHDIALTQTARGAIFHSRRPRSASVTCPSAVRAARNSR